MALGVALALVCALGWGAFDAWRKRLAVVMPVAPLVVVLSLGHVPLFAGWVGLTGGQITSTAYWAPGLGSVLLNVVGNLTFLYAVRVSPLSRMIPLLSFVPVFAALLAVPMLGETLTPGQWLGVATVVVGAVLLGADVGREPGPPGPPESLELRGPAGWWMGLWGLVRALLRERGSIPMLVTAAVWAGTLVLDKRALVFADSSVHGLVIMSGMSVGTLLWLVVRGELGQLRRLSGSWGTYGVALALGGTAMGVQLVAIPLVMLALLEAIKRAVGLFCAVVMGRLMFGEPVTGAKVVAVLVMGGGASLVLLAG
ncbi:MAG: EamA family transporter [Myxococcota bacterium]